MYNQNCFKKNFFFSHKPIKYWRIQGMVLFLIFSLRIIPITADNRYDLGVSGPSARYGHAMVSLSNGEVILIGGESEDGAGNPVFHNDLWMLDVDPKMWKEVIPLEEPPTARKFHRISNHDDAKVIITGGKDSDGHKKNDLPGYRVSDKRWVNLYQGETEYPERCLHAACVSEDKMIVAGGYGPNGELSDTRIFNFSDYTWSQGENSPYTFSGVLSNNYPIAAISGQKKVNPHSEAVAKAEDQRMYILYIFNDGNMIYYSLTNDEWITFTPTGEIPPQLMYYASAHDSSRAWVFGGYNVETGEISKETWEFNFDTHAWIQRIDMPFALRDAAAAYSEGHVILFGGMTDADTLSGRTFEYIPSSSTSIEQNNVIPKSFNLSQNYPNPFNCETKIGFTLKKESQVILKIYNIRGQEVDRLLDKPYGPGQYEVVFDADKFPSGIYYYQIQADGFQDMKKMMLLK